jgi:hypothetical protein
MKIENTRAALPLPGKSAVAQATHPHFSVTDGATVQYCLAARVGCPMQDTEQFSVFNNLAIAILRSGINQNC